MVRGDGRTSMRRAAGCALLALACAVQAAHAAPAAPAPASPGGGVADLSIEELRDVVVSSVSRHESSLLGSAASVYVISGDDIRRLGLTTLPEALRLAPNLQVARIDASRWAISARGFNSDIANKLLVLVDGRTVYSPLFSGVFWDMQEFTPADIERIEVISGPAGVAWGTNAVNGVINIVNKSADGSAGAWGRAVAGTRERAASARYGGAGDDGALHWRVQGRADGQDAMPLAAGGGSAHDGMHGQSATLRADWLRDDDHLLLDVGALRVAIDDRGPGIGTVNADAAHAQVRWTRRLGAQSEVDLKAWDDYTERRDGPDFHERDDITAVEGRWRGELGPHRLQLGAEHRQSHDDVTPGVGFTFVPPQVTQHWDSVFVQDEWSLPMDSTLTLGERAERNPYTGWEHLPSVRLGYGGDPHGYLWVALSRAVRSPSRLDRDFYVPGSAPHTVLSGGPGFRSEVANVLEGGWRRQLADNASASATVFVQRYDRLRSVETLPDGTVVLGNGIAGTVRGLEAWGNWQPLPAWRLDAGLTLLDKDLHVTAGSTDPVGPSRLGNDAPRQASLRSSHRLSDDVEAAVSLRYVGALPEPRVPAYAAVDVQLQWHLAPRWQAGLGVRNLAPGRHVEFDSGPRTTEVSREALLSITYEAR